MLNSGRMARWTCPDCECVISLAGLTHQEITQWGICPNGHKVWRIQDADHVSGYSWWFLVDFIIVTMGECENG